MEQELKLKISRQPIQRKDQVGKAIKQIGTSGSLIVNAANSQLSKIELEEALFKCMAEKHLIPATVVKIK